MQVTASSFTPDVSRTPSPTIRSEVRDYFVRSPQAHHRYLNRDDMRWGCDLTPPSPPQPSRSPRPRLARAPGLPTILEDWRLRCRRIEIDDPSSFVGTRFSAIYCPPVYGAECHEGVVRALHSECLENFAILRPQQGGYVNITLTTNDDRRAWMYRRALTLYREAFDNGLLR